MADAVVRLPDDSANTGAAVDQSALTRGDGTAVKRQRVVLGDDLNAAEQARVLGRELQTDDPDAVYYLAAIDRKLGRIFEVLCRAYDIDADDWTDDDPDEG